MSEENDMSYTLDDPRARALFFNLEEEIERLRKYLRTLEKENSNLRAALHTEQISCRNLKQKLSKS